MTIANTTIQLPLLGATEQPSGGGTLDATLSSIEIPADSASAGDSEQEFWAMLSQQFSRITEQEDAKVIENRDLMALVSAFEDDLEAAGEQAVIPAEWMQFLKTHFSDTPVTSEGATIASDELEIDSGAVVAPSIEVGVQLDAESATGDELPSGRQGFTPELAVAPAVVASPVMPDKILRDIKSAAATSTAASAAMPTPAVALTAESMAINQHRTAADVETDLELPVLPAEKSADKSADKMQPRFVLPDTPAVSNRAGDSFPTSPVNQPAAIAPQAAPLNPPGTATMPLPTAMQTLTLPPTAPASQWGEAIGERVSLLINHKLNSAEIRIDPPHLGRLDIQIQVKEDSAVVVIHTQHAQTRDLIDSAGQRLREFLQESGYDSVDVSVSHREQSMAQGGESGGHSGQGAQLSADDMSLNQEVDGRDLQHASLLMTEQGRVDFFA